MTKQKIKNRIKEHQTNIKLNKDITALMIVDNSINYAIKREAIEILSVPLNCNKMKHSLVDERWMLEKK